MSNDLEWIRQYRAALNESDPGKRLTRIEEAERALKQALRLAIEKGDSDQRHRISEALHHLTLLRMDIQEDRSQMSNKIERSGCRFSIKSIDASSRLKWNCFTLPYLRSHPSISALKC